MTRKSEIATEKWRYILDMEVIAPFFRARVVPVKRASSQPEVFSLGRAESAFDAGNWQLAIHNYKEVFRRMKQGPILPLNEQGVAAVSALRAAREKWSAELKRNPLPDAAPQLFMVHVGKNYGGGGQSVAEAHRRLLEVFPPEQVREISGGAQPYLGHRGQNLLNDATNHYVPGSISPEIVLTGGGFGKCHFYDFRTQVDQLAEKAFLLGRRVMLKFHFIGEGIFRLPSDPDPRALNLHQCRSMLAANEFDKLRRSLAAYLGLESTLEPEYALPIKIQIHPTAEQYLAASYRG